MANEAPKSPGSKEIRLLRGSGLELRSIKQIANAYGVNRNVFEARDANDNRVFAKIDRESAIRGAVEHSTELSKHIATPEVRHHIYNSDSSVLVCDFFEGMQMTDLVLQAEAHGNFDAVFDIENTKNAALKQLYWSTVRSIDAAKYATLPAQALFRNRILGARYNKYYGASDSHNVATRFDKHVLINGRRFEHTPRTIIESIREKLRSAAESNMIAHLGHGDAHHQNILVGSDQAPTLIDLEYAGLVTPRMELAKPYYNDLIGTLFYFFQNMLEQRLVLKQSNFSDDASEFDIEYTGELSHRAALAQNKVDHMAELLENPDPLSLNDYLIIAHLTTRNPNTYSATSQGLFLSLIPALHSFDSTCPVTLFDVFER